MDLARIHEERLGLVKQAQDVIDGASAEDRELNQEEQNRWDALMADVDTKGETLKRAQRQAEVEKELAAPQGTKAARRDAIGDGPQERAAASKKEQRETFSRWIKGGSNALSAKQQDELRALAMDSDIAGGFLVAPQEFVASLIQFVNDAVWMRQLGTIVQVANAESLGVPVLDADPADSDWTAEIATGSEDSTLKFGKRELRPHPLAKRIKVSNKLLRASVMDVESIVIERLGYKFAISAEKAYLSGTGANQPLGVFTASATGISTGQDVSTGNTTTSITADGLIEAKMKLKANYWPRATWIFHRDALKQIRKLKDGNGQYLWAPYGYGVQGAGGPPQMPAQNLSQGAILDSPYVLSEYAPNTFTTGLYVGIIGDFTRYWIADSLQLQIQRLVELYAETNQVGFVGRLESDGMPVLEEAFARVKLA